MNNTVEIPLETQLEDARKEIKKLRNVRAENALALALLQEVEEYIQNADPVWLATRWVPGLKELRSK